MDSSSANAAPFSPSASFNPEDMQGSAKGGTAGEVRHPYYAPYFPYTTMLLIASIGSLCYFIFFALVYTKTKRKEKPITKT